MFEGNYFSSLNLPPTLRKIDNYAFSAFAVGYNDRLRRVIVNSQLDTIGYSVFQYALKCIHFTTGDRPPYVVGGAINSDHLDSIVVPCGTRDTWLADSYWGRDRFVDKYYEDCSDIDDVDIDDIATDDIKVYSLDGRIVIEGAEGEKVHVYDMMGRPLNTQYITLNTGIYLVRIGNRPARKVTVLR